MPERLTPLDASFLHTETASAHMHVAWKGRFRPDPSRPPITLARVRAQVASRLGGAPRFRMRLAFPPGGFAAPVWVDAEGFDLRRHVVALSTDGEVLARGEFDARADAALSSPLDRSHPLWEIHLAPRLEDGSVGLVMKIHHAMVDGKSALAVALLLLDLDPNAPEPAPPVEAWAGDRAPGPARLAVEALVESGAEPLRALGRAARAAGSPPRLGGTLRRAALAVGEDVARSAPSSFLNPAIGPRRMLVGHTVGVERLLDVKRAWGGSLNDVALTVVAGALRQLALLRRVAPAPMKVMVPVSRRGEDEMADMGNRIAFVFITLPVHLRDPLARLAAIREQTAAFKETERASRRRGAAERARDAPAAAAGAGRALRGVGADVQPRRLQRARAARAGLPARRRVHRGAAGDPALRGPRAVDRRVHAARQRVLRRVRGPGGAAAGARAAGRLERGDARAQRDRRRGAT